MDGSYAACRRRGMRAPYCLIEASRSLQRPRPCSCLNPRASLGERQVEAHPRRPSGLNSPATRSSAGFVMRQIQTGLHKPEGGTKQRLTKSADNSAPVCFPNCASICLGSRVSFDLPLALPLLSGREGGLVSKFEASSSAHWDAFFFAVY